MTSRANQSWPSDHYAAEIDADTIQPKFNVGDTITWDAFTDCFGQFHAAHHNLTVIGVRLIECDSMPSYFRVTAYGDGLSKVEGAERYFSLEVR